MIFKWAFICWAAGTNSLPFYCDSELTPSWSAAACEHRMPNFSMTDQLGRTFTSNGDEQQLWVVSFFFTSCGGICPRLNANLRHLQSQLTGKPVSMLSISVMPSVDTVDVLHHYAKRFGADRESWLFLRGDIALVRSLARQFFFADNAPVDGTGSDQLVHSENVYLIDREGRIRGVYHGTRAMEISLLNDDIQTLLMESPTAP